MKSTSPIVKNNLWKYIRLGVAGVAELLFVFSELTICLVRNPIAAAAADVATVAAATAAAAVTYSLLQLHTTRTLACT